MNRTTSAQFVCAGIQLYPQCGYHRLSEEAVARHACTDPEAFREAFADKDTFMAAILSEHRDRVLGRVSFDCSPQICNIERLREIVWRLAVTMHSNLPWLHRMLLDSAEGVRVISRALKAENDMLSAKLMEMIRICHGGQPLTPLALTNEYDFLQGAVFMPMIVNTNYQVFGILSDDLSARMPDLLDDAVIHQRIDWVIGSLFGC